MRSGVGAACPFTRFDLFLEELFPDLLDFPGVVPAGLGWDALALLGVVLWLLLAGALCAAAAGRVKPPAAVAARIHPISDCLQSKVRITGLMRRRSITCRRPEQRPAGRR